MTSFYRHILILLLSFTLISTISAQKYNNVVRPKIDRIVNKLQKDKCIHFGYAVGYSGKPEINNKYYKLYKKLKNKATNDELLALTKNKSATIVVYAFNILHSRNYDGLKSVFLDHINDTLWFWTAGGCTGFVDRINWFMLRRLRPVTDNSIKICLTKNEYDFYCSKFKNEDKKFDCE